MSTQAQAQPTGTFRTLRRGLALSPELRAGLAGTVALALVSMIGRAAVPVAIQQGIDKGLSAAGGPDVAVILRIVGVTVGILAITTTCGYFMMRRLFTVSETALANLRVRAFRHIHDLSMLHQQSERRGTLVSRVTSDIDTITQFLQWGGVILLVNGGQLVVTTIVMSFYSWKLTLVVLAAFVPAIVVIRAFQKRLAGAYAESRRRIGVMLGAVSESVVGASVIRAYGISERSGAKLSETIDDYQRAQRRAMRLSVTSFSTGEIAAALALSAVVVVGTRLGVAGQITLGELTAYLFLVTLFIQPVQIATEVLNELQNATAGWSRVLDVLALKPDVADPAHNGVDLPEGPLDVRFDRVSFAYPGGEPGQTGPRVLHDVHLDIPAKTRVAVVGETGSGKTTFAKLLTRLMDPTDGTVHLSGTPLTSVRFGSLRARVVMVPQDGFLFDASIAANVRFARPDLTDEQLTAAFAELGLLDWVQGLTKGLDTQVGERGEALSVGERQLVALVRAYVADPDLLVLDEATSAVDPATEVRLQRTLDAVTRGRTTIAIAHRLSTAQAADEVIVVDRGVVVQRGPHDELVTHTDSIYAKLYASWLEQTR
ncbi:multidrug ABC transporter ATP-binding protein [Catellatospora sp. TT07R-123]|uniref:ABC transporter ATP-binding protein n=1 Tax=Catellatospora sp. TT07R-123 TaxID=2733863 RepID=UPI001B198F72|nr:ABC transporter ATP-binding protein [Catellatospora sp. TT07R-123]GHJ44910.1 multidrug ABC transporter ATP-binding protein [Catellatospora sp. TT07R-123]